MKTPTSPGRNSVGVGIKQVELYQKKTTANKRGIRRRKCNRCGLIHKPMSESVKWCGACSVRALAHAWRVLTR